MVNVQEIGQKLLTQFKNNHQKSISDDNLCRKLIDKFEENGLICEVLALNDPRNLVLGYRAGNCFRINDK